MGIGKVKLRKADKLFTQYMRLLYDYTCQKCGRKYLPEGSLRNLGVSHYWSRRYELTRFDPENCTLLCNLPCHQELEMDKKGEYKEYMIERLGQEGFDLLEFRAHQYQKRDDYPVELWLKQEIERLKNGG